ncbi:MULTISPECIES: hypothetical protein [unclassified Hyphomonas]|uniref:hypothetical protein n=1 Tax=unclassified Hyphomonas TaxID=2630699 RepID=UPI000458AE5C|nr:MULTISPECIES: hypothetical protein [unclassified Hyphomonas]KCZ48664.1 hypothetical protein HY17_16305 [Hyphomonas sp. CY54-11-8]
MRHRTWKLALVYGAAAFVFGFFFGALRELVFMPWLGDPAAHWLEFPLVTSAICFLGYRSGRGIGFRTDTWTVGLGGVAVLLLIESGFALGLLRQPPDEYLASFDIRRGALFPIGLAAMALAPRFGWRTC